LRLQGGGRFAFIELNDGSSFGNLQIIVNKESEGFSSIEKGVGTGTSLLAKGLIVKSPGNKQLVEMQAKFVEVLGSCDAGKYPLAKTKLELDFLRTVAHLRPRTNTIAAVARVRNALAFATHKFFHDKGFYYVHTPLITASDCEGAGEMFSVTTLLNGIQSLKDIPRIEKTDFPDYSKDFFGTPSYLTVSGQLEGENYACALSQIYTFGPTFRAEYSHTTRHLAEFWMIEPEIAFADLQDNMDLAEGFLKYTIEYLLETCPDEMDFFNKLYEKGLIDRLKHVLASPFQRLTYTQAIDLLLESKQKFEIPVVWGMDLKSEHERFICEQIYKKPVIISDYPKEVKSFYMRLNDDGKTVAAMDVLVPKIGEIIGGSQREERLEIIENRLEEFKLKKENYSWYLDLRRFGSVIHSGFGLGFERLVLFATGIENIRDVIPFPRYPGHAEF
jgi:asparaginyl-tRNA synthetase